MKRRDIEIAVESHCSTCLGHCVDSSECPDHTCQLWPFRTVTLCQNYDTTEELNDGIEQYCESCSTKDCADCHLDM